MLLSAMQVKAQETSINKIYEHKRHDTDTINSKSIIADDNNMY